MSDLKLKNKHKILFVSHNLELEGATWSLFYLVKGLRERGYRADVVSPKTGPMQDFFKNEGIDVRIHNYSGLGGVYGKINNENYDVIYVNTIVGYEYVNRTKPEERKKKVIWCIRESEREVYFKQFPDLHPALFESVYKVVFVSDVTKEIYEDLDKSKKFEVIHNGLDLRDIDKFTNKNAKSVLRQKYGFSEEDYIINLTGTVCHRKGQMEFTEAAIKILRNPQFRNIKFLMIGAGRGSAYEQRIRDLISDENLENNIILINETPKVFDYYLMSDVFVCNSYIESFPRVVLEGMAFGLPIIATKIYGIVEQIEDSQDGILIMAGDVDELAKKIIFLKSNPTEAEKLGKNSRKKVEKYFTLDAMIDKYEKMINSMQILPREKEAVIMQGDREKYIFDILACPKCYGLLDLEKKLCLECGHRFEIKNNTPVFLGIGSDYIQRFSEKNHTNPYSPKSLKIIKENPGAKILDFGAGNPAADELFSNVIRLEFVHYGCTDVVSTERSIPFKDNSFDYVISESVFEHVKDPFFYAKEIHRVLKKDGLVLIDTAFLQPVHCDPHHYYNMTLEGLRNVFSDFEEIEAGVEPYQTSGYTMNIAIKTFYDQINNESIKEEFKKKFLTDFREYDKYIPKEKQHIMSAGVYFVGKK